MNSRGLIKGNLKKRSLFLVFVSLLALSLACNLTDKMKSEENPNYTVDDALDDAFADISAEPGSDPGSAGGEDTSGTGSSGDLKPVGFINHGSFDAVVLPWTYVPLESDLQKTPVSASTVSSSIDSGGTWPNTSRFLSLPMGTYTWCIDWEEGDQDEDGQFDYYHYFDTNPVLLDENDSDELEFAESVDIAAPPSTAQIFEGRCGQPVVAENTCTGEGIETQAHVIYMNNTSNPPDIVAWAGEAGPEGITLSFGGGTTTWGTSRILWVAGDWVEATTSNPYKALGVQVQGDRTIGWARVLFDGVEVWQGNTATTWNDGTNNGVYVEVRCFSPGQHILRIEALGIDGGGGGITIPVSYFGFRQ